MQLHSPVADGAAAQHLQHIAQGTSWALLGSPTRATGDTQLSRPSAPQQVRVPLSEAVIPCQSPAARTLGSLASSAGTAAAAASASPTLAVLAVTARELLHEIEAAAADSPMSVAQSSTKSGRRRGHSSKSSSKRRQRQHEQMQELQFSHMQQLEQEYLQASAAASGAQASSLYMQQQPAPTLQQQQEDQHAQGLSCQEQQNQQDSGQGLLQQQQPGAQLDPGASTSDSVGWSAVLHKYELHKIHMAQLLSDIDHHHQQQSNQVARQAAHSPNRAATSAPAVFIPGPAAAVSPTVLGSRSGRHSRLAHEAGGASASAVDMQAALAVGMQAAGLDPGLRLRIQQLRSSASDGRHSTGRTAGHPAQSAAAAAAAAGQPAQSAAAAAASAAAGLGASAADGCPGQGYAAYGAAGLMAAGAGEAAGGGPQAELEYLLAERHLAAALLKHLAAVAAADAAATATCTGGMLSPNALSSPAALLDEASGAVAGAEARLDHAWLQLPQGSCLKSGVLSSSGSSSRSDLASDFKAVATHVASALSRHQQQAAALTSKLASYQATQQQLQQQLAANEAQMRELRDCLGTAEASKQVAVQAAVAQTEARYGRRLVKVEAKVLGMAQQHEAAIQQAHCHLEQQTAAAKASSDAAERCRVEAELLQRKVHQLETDRQELLTRADEDRTAAIEARQQVCLLQGEQRSLLSALEAVESALHDARNDCDEQTTLRQRYESALEHKTQTISHLRRELKEARKVAEQAAGEVLTLQEQMSALKARATDTARQLSAARTAAKDASESQQREQQRAAAATAALQEAETELLRLEKVAANTGKAQSADSRRAAVAEAAAAAAHAAATAAECAAESLRQQLETAKSQAVAAEEAVADAVAAQKCIQQRLDERQQRWQQQEQQHTQHIRQLQEQLQQQEQQLGQCKAALAEARNQAVAADSGLASIRSEVAQWMKLRSDSLGTSSRGPAAVAAAGVVAARAAAAPAAVCARATHLAGRISSSSQAAPGLSSQHMSAAGQGHARPYPAAGSSGRAGAQASIGSSQRQAVPVAVAEQLQQQAQDLICLQRQVAHLQAQLAEARQRLQVSREQLFGSQQDHQAALQQLTAAKEALAVLEQRLHQQQQQQQQQHRPWATGQAACAGDGRQQASRSQPGPVAGAAEPDQQQAMSVQEQQQLLAQMQELQHQLRQQQQRQQDLHAELQQHQQQLQQHHSLQVQQREAAAAQVQLLQSSLAEAEERVGSLQQEVTASQAVLAVTQESHKREVSRLQAQLQRLQGDVRQQHQQQECRLQWQVAQQHVVDAAETYAGAPASGISRRRPVSRSGSLKDVGCRPALQQQQQSRHSRRVSWASQEDCALQAEDMELFASGCKYPGPVQQQQLLVRPQQQQQQQQQQQWQQGELSNWSSRTNTAAYNVASNSAALESSYAALVKGTCTDSAAVAAVITAGVGAVVGSADAAAVGAPGAGDAAPCTPEAGAELRQGCSETGTSTNGLTGGGGPSAPAAAAGGAAAVAVSPSYRGLSAELYGSSMFDIHEQVMCEALGACDAATAVGIAVATAATAARGNQADVPAALTESDSLLCYSLGVHGTEGAQGAAGRLQAKSSSGTQQQAQQLAAANSLSMLPAALLSSDDSGSGSSDSGSGSDTDLDDGGSGRRTGSSGSSSVCTSSALENLKTALMKQRRLQQQQEEQQQVGRDGTLLVLTHTQPPPQKQQQQQEQLQPPVGACSVVRPSDGAAVGPAVFRSETPDSDCGCVLAAAAAALQAAG